jgi:hypothetical protein
MINLEEKIRDFFLENDIAPEQENGRSFIFNCPVCDGSKKLFIQKDSGRSICFRKKYDECPSGGSAAYALHKLSGKSLQSVNEFFAGRAKPISSIHSMVFPWEIPKFEAKDPPLPIAAIPADTQMDNIDQEALDYLLSRGITEPMQKELDIMYSPSMRRIVFPVFDKGNIVGWQGRAIDPVDHAFRMYNCPGSWKAKTLMFNPVKKNGDSIVVAEGPFDAMKFYGTLPFVATMGKNISKHQVDLFSIYDKVYLALDRDAGNLLRDLKLKITEVNPRATVFYVQVPKNREDFGECSFQECSEAVSNATKITGFEIFLSW